MTKNALVLRFGLLASVLFVAVVAGLSACSSSPNSPSPVAATATPALHKLMVAVTVSNTHFGNAVPSDFKLSVAYDGPAGSTTSVEGSTSGVEVAVPPGASYQVSVAALDGYTTRLSAGCAGTSIVDSATCEVAASDMAVTCDKALWDPVYAKDRLRVLSACEVATGTVMGTEIERDGDLEIWMRPDPKYSRLMRPGNEHSKGWFVIEIPCQAPIVQQDAIGTCDNFTGRKVRVPHAGEHIVAAAPWVEDRRHYLWGELHGAVVVKLPR